MTMSQASAMFAPAPAATPFTAQTTGSARPRSAEHQRPVVVLDRCAEIDRRVARRDGAIGQVLPGAKAAAGAGQQQHARIAVVARRGASASRNSACICVVKLFSRSGRLSVMRAMPSATFESDLLVVLIMSPSTGYALERVLTVRCPVGSLMPGQTCARCWTTRKRFATYAGIGQRRIGSRIGAGAVEIGERRRLVDEHAAGQVDRQRDADVLGDVDRPRRSRRRASSRPTSSARRGRRRRRARSRGCRRCRRSR